jgi:spore maturation protein CgeB
MRILFLHTPSDEQLTGSLYRAALALGAQCEYFDLLGATAATQMRIDSRLVRRAVRPLLWNSIGKRLLRDFGNERFDLILQIKGLEYSPAVLRKLKAGTGARLFNYYPDSPFYRSSSSRRLKRSIPITDIFFTFTEEFVAPLQRLGSPCAKVLSFARDEALHRPATLTPKEREDLACDVSFVGSWSADREYWLSQLGGVRLGIWGPAAPGNWSGHLGSSFRGGPVNSSMTAKILAASSMTINVIRNWDDLNAVPGSGHTSRYWGIGQNMRSFEALACGAFLLSSRTANLERLFREGEEVEFFSTESELKRKVAYYMDHENERSRIATAGYRRVEAETYRVRFKEILRSYDSLQSGRLSA